MASGALEQSALEAKDREQLLAIAKALGVKSAARAKKEEIIEMILEQTAPAPVVAAPSSSSTGSKRSSASASASDSSSSAASKSDGPMLGADGQPLAEWEIELAEHEGTPIAPEARRRSEQGDSRGDDRGPRNDRNDRNDRGPRNDRNDRGSRTPQRP